MIKDYLKLSIINLTHRKLRSFLTLLGIIIGISILVIIISLGEGLKIAVNNEFNKLGIDKLIITPGSSLISTDSNIKLDYKDKRVIELTKGVDSSIGLHYQNAKISFKDEDAYLMVYSLPINENPSLVKEIYVNYGLYKGRLLSKGDELKAVVGFDFSKKNKIFSKEVNIGDKIFINNHKVSIIGIFNTFGNSADDSSIYLPKRTYEKIFGIDVDENYKMIFAKIEEDSNPSIVEENIKKNLRNSRGLDEGNEDFTVQSTEDLMNSFNNILLIINIFIIGIAAISLLVGGIGISNTMYTAVLERKKEIGIMKAIGAKNSDILYIFLFESGVLGLFGGILGLIIGLVFSKIIEYFGKYVFNTPYIIAWFDWKLILGTLLFSFVIGVLSGLMPANQASKEKPADNLRYE